MKITVAGAGYVGLVTSVCLAKLGHQVTCIDIEKEKIDQLQKGECPIYEPGLAALLQKNLSSGNLRFTFNPHQAYSDAEIIFITVGTPENPDGSVDLKYIFVVAHTIAHHLERDVMICTKSTVPVGTNETIKDIIDSRKPSYLNAEVVSTPEFLREGSAIYDFFHGDRIIIGTDNAEAASVLEELFMPLKIPTIVTDINSAEMIKYASNAFLATKISFINEMAAICEKVGANIEEVAYGIGKDKRIGPHFLQAGIGYGGSCFPKDTNALVKIAGNVKHRFELLESVIKVNNHQQSLPVRKAKEIISSLFGKKVAVLGLSFKPDTDDVRESPSLAIIRELLEEGVAVTVYDPIAIPKARRYLGNEVEYASNLEAAIDDKEAVIIATDWDQIKYAPLDLYVDRMKVPIVIDGRNCYSLQEVQKYPITYISIGRPVIHNLKKKNTL